MTDRNDPYKVSLDVQVGQGGQEPSVVPEMPFSIGVIGDFSGRGAARADTPQELGPVLVDPDNVLHLAGFRPELRLSLGDEAEHTLTIRFRELEDFHPDRLVDAVPPLARLMEIRRQLADPGTFRQAMLEQAEPAESGRPREPEPRIEPGSSNVVTGLLDAIVDETAVEPPSARDAVRSGLDRYVRQVVRPHLVAGADPEQTKMLAGVDSALETTLRDLLHHPELQRLEATWRSVFSLVSRAVAVESRIRVYLIDMSRAEMERDLLGDGDLRGSGLFRALAGQSGGAPDGSPWAVLMGLEPLGSEVADVATMSRIAQLVSMFGVSWLSTGGPDFASELVDRREVAEKGPSFSAAWDAFRGTEAARSLGVVVPRLLLRLPYGEETDPCERVRFEEVSTEWTARDYLWGDSAHLCALTLSRLAFGRSAPTGLAGDFDGLPVHLGSQDGTRRTQPCAEDVITDDAALGLMANGLTPIQVSRDQGLARVLRMQSSATPVSPLTFWWMGRTVFGG